MTKKGKEGWYAVGINANRYIAEGMNQADALKKAGASEAGYYRARQQYGLPALNRKGKGSKAKKHFKHTEAGFVSYAPIGQGGITIEIGQVKFTVPRGDVEALKTIIAAARGDE